MSISVDPEAVLEARRVLLHVERTLTDMQPVAPPTGDTTDRTAAAITVALTAVAALAADCRRLAETLTEVVADLERRDDDAGAWLGRLRNRDPG